MKKILFTLIPFLVALSSYSGPKRPPFDEEIRWSLNHLPKTIDNLEWRSLDRWYVLNQVVETLVKYKSHYNLEAALAKKWTVDTERLIYTFTLKDEIKFSNGREIVSDDIIFSLKRYLLGQNNANILKDSIVEAKKLKNIDGSIAGLRKINRKTFSIVLNKKLECLWSFLASPNSGGVVDKSSIDLKTLKMKFPFHSSGQYIVQKKEKNHIRLMSNPFYYGSSEESAKSIGLYRHENDQVADKWFREKKTNFRSLLDPFQKSEVAQIDNNNIIRYHYHRVGLLYLNPKSKIFRLRENRELIKKVMLKDCLKKYGLGNVLSWGNSFFPIGTPGYIRSMTKGCPKIGHKIKGGKEVTILLEKGLNDHLTKKILEERLSLLGLKVIFVHENKITMAKKFINLDFEMGVTSLGLPIADHEFGIYLYFVEKPHYLKDLTGAIVQSYKEIVKKSTIKEKKTLMKAIAREIEKQGILLPFYHTSVQYFMSKEIEQGRSSVYNDLILGDLKVKKKRP